MTEAASKSKYAAKKESGKQMYGPGCCAHTVTASQIQTARAKSASQNRRKDYLPPDPITWS